MANILIVDDEPDILHLLRRILERFGHKVHQAPDGRTALRMYAGNPADVVITDILMPEMDGLEFLTRVREAFPDARIIALSGGGLVAKEELLRDAVQFGAVGFLKKPFTVEECLEAVRTALEWDDREADELAEGA
jgi:DNA-binding NtrC family response regulator